MTVIYNMLGNYGRMGNALFEAAATIGYAKKYNKNYLFPYWQDRQHFNINNEHFTDPLHFRIQDQYTEPTFSYTEIPYTEKVLNLNGYFQSYKYFDNCQDYIKSLFGTVITTKTKKKGNCCAIHVRRGDYVRLQNYHPVQPMTYYREAMDVVGADHYYIYSDDINWCKENFKENEKSKFIFSHGNYINDFIEMQQFNKHIIANSTYSWWAAWLASSEQVVYPANWFGKNLKHNDTKDLFLPDWILI